MVNRFLSDPEIIEILQKKGTKKVYTSYLRKNVIHKCIVDMSTWRLECGLGNKPASNLVVEGESIDMKYSNENLSKKQAITLIGPKKAMAKMLRDFGILEKESKYVIAFKIVNERVYDCVSVTELV